MASSSGSSVSIPAPPQTLNTAAKIRVWSSVLHKVEFVCGACAGILLVETISGALAIAYLPLALAPISSTNQPDHQPKAVCQRLCAKGCMPKAVC